MFYERSQKLLLMSQCHSALSYVPICRSRFMSRSKNDYNTW